MRILKINTFKTAIKTIGEHTKEPVFDDSVDYTCNIENDYYIVNAFNLSEEKLSELKDKYQWVKEEQVEVEDSNG